jgi:ketosteroid isomerase-like protein
MPGARVETMQLAIDAFNRRDSEAFGALFTPDARIVPVRAAVEDAVYEGADAGAQYCVAVEVSWQDLRWEVDEIRDGGSWVLALGHIRGRGRQSGAEIDAYGGWLARFDGPAIANFQTFSERDEALAAAGLEE